MQGKSSNPLRAAARLGALAPAACWPWMSAQAAPFGDPAAIGLTEMLIGLALLASLAALLLVRLQTRKKQVETALNALPVAVIQLDAKGALNYLNPAGAAMLGLAAAADGAPPTWSFIDHATRAGLLDGLLERARKDGSARIPASARLVNGHGLELEVEGSCQPLHDAQGRTSGYLLQLRDVTEESEWRRQQPDLWDREPISTLPGRGFMENRLNLALLNRRAGDLPMTYLEIRIAGIRAVYEAAGEAAGDRLVRHLTALLHAQVRETDLIARMDEETFAVLLNFCPAEVSRRIAGKILASLDGFRFEWAGTSHATPAELGQVDVPPFVGSLDELLVAARPTAQPA